MPEGCQIQLTQCSRVILQNLTGSQLVKESSAFYKTQRLNCSHGNSPPLVPVQVRLIKSMLSHSTYSRSIFNIILPPMLRCSRWSVSFMFPHQNPIWNSLNFVKATCAHHLILLIAKTVLGVETNHKTPHYIICSCLLLFPVSLAQNIFLSTLFLNTLCLCPCNNTSNHSLIWTQSYLFHACNFDLLVLFQNIWNLTHILYCNFFQYSADKTWRYT